MKSNIKRLFSYTLRYKLSFTVSIIGFLIFAEVPEIWTWIGSAVIVGSTTYIAHRERKARGKNLP